MAAIAHSFAEQQTRQTTTSTSYGTITGASIDSSNFTDGKKYLVLANAQVSSASASCAVCLQTTHGGTAFTDAEMRREKTATDVYTTYTFFKVWTAVSGEGLAIQFKAHADSGGTAAVDCCSLLAICISDDLTENTDWFENVDLTDTALASGSWTTGGTVTWTPAIDSQRWLVLSRAKYTQAARSAGADEPMSRINVGSGTTVLPRSVGQVDFLTDGHWMTMARVLTLASSAVTICEESSVWGADTGTQRLNSAVFILNLDKFATVATVYTESGTALSATDYATALQTTSITPSVQGDVWIGAYWGFDQNSEGRTTKFRVQVDNSDQPTGQTAQSYNFQLERSANAALTEGPVLLSTLVTNMTAASHTIDLDASVDATTSTPAGQQASLWAVSMELAGGATSPGAGNDNAVVNANDILGVVSVSLSIAESG